MLLTRFTSALAAASLLSMAVAQTITPNPTIKNPIATPTTIVPAREMTAIGCFESPAPAAPFENHGPYEHQSRGNCQLVCLQLGKNVMALSDGTNCYCGDVIPNVKLDNGTCVTKCPGFPDQTCGGLNALWVMLTGNTYNRVPAYTPLAQTSSISTGTATPTPGASSAPSGAKSNTVAIAIGIVVGVVALIAVGVGVWFFVRRRRQRQAEEDYRRNAANVNQFVGHGKSSNSSMNDSRLDPSFMDRRQSNGSIADNEDYSRRILKVTNA